MGRCSRWVLVIQICFLGYCVMSREASGQSHQDAHHPGPAHGHWNYQDKTEWKSDFPHCEGKEQSPININTRHTTFDPNLKPIRLSGYNLTSEETLTLKNNGHTVVLDLPDSLEIIGGLSQTYRAAQLHFHWGSETSPGSEHTVNGHRFHGEVHVVHYSTEYKSVQEAQSQPGGLAVLAAFIQEGEDASVAYEQLLSYFPSVEADGQSTLIPGFDIRGLLPQRLDRYYRYNGSLTTPPCYQSVNWTIFNQTIKLAPEQLDILEDTIHTEHDHRLQMNYRGPQDLNSRLVLSNFKQVLMGRRGPAVAPNTDDSSSHEGPEAQEAHAMSTGDMLAILFGVLFVVTACAFFVYIRKTHKRNARSVSENKSNVIYKAATTEENVA